MPGEWALEGRVETPAGWVAAGVLGEGPPVVLVHGTPSSSFLWRNVAPALADAGLSVHVFDLLGFGSSERHEDQRVSIAPQARVLASLVAHWRIVPTLLAGHDIGGATVLRAHLLEGVPAERLALIDAVALRPWITPATRHMQRHLDVYRTMPAHIFREVAAAHLSTATDGPMSAEAFEGYFGQWEGERGQALWLRNVAQFDEAETAEFEPLLPTMRTPTRVIWGEQDAWLPLETAHRLVDLLPAADLVTIPAAGHFSPEDDADAVARALLEAVAR